MNGLFPVMDKLDKSKLLHLPPMDGLATNENGLWLVDGMLS